MHSPVMKNLRSKSLPILALALWFIEISGSVSLHPVLTGPDLAYLRSRVAFRCFAPLSPSPVTYELLMDGVPIASSVDVEGDQPAPFLFKVSAASEGSYHCEATAGGSTGVSNNIKLSVVTPALNTRVLSDPFPPVTYEGSRIILSCNVSKGSHLSYTWFFNRKEVTPSTSPVLHLTGNKLVLENVTPEQTGSYYCMAWSQVHDIRRFSTSSEMLVTVKAHISKPQISFSIFKIGGVYQGNVSCWSTRGSPPVNFSLLLDDREVGPVTASESLTAWFPVEIVPGLDMGVAQCRMKNEVQELMSEPVSLEVVPVGGDVRVDVEYLYRADFLLTAATLNCEVSRGTFPQISWIFNDSVLVSELSEGSHIKPTLSHYALAGNGQTLMLTRIGPEESGYYRCRARNTYDDSGPWMKSAAVLVRVTDALTTTMEVIIIVFCSFVLLILLAGLFLIYKVLDQDRAHGHAPSDAGFDGLSLSARVSLSRGSRAFTASADCDVQSQVCMLETNTAYNHKRSPRRNKPVTSLKKA
ncbi:Fc receptor-like protein 5 isoform X2 [Halichoeres trimaculatus]|uniref:Fc receptor-like protein 5 isoform X2 n=1 Tax=Halichoeres trimaculatus TaxID=147232 RepID=UPI003D9DD87A